MTSPWPPPRRKPLCLFDLDRTLLEGRTLDALGEAFGLQADFERVLEGRGEGEPASSVAEAERVARQLEGRTLDEVARAAARSPLREGAPAGVALLVSNGFNVGVVSASYLVAVERVACALGADFGVGLGLVEDRGKLTGDIVVPPIGADRHGCGRAICKGSVLEAVRTLTGAPFVGAVGDGENDACMLELADAAVAVEPCHPRAREAAHATAPDPARAADFIASARRTMRRAPLDV